MKLIDDAKDPLVGQLFRHMDGMVIVDTHEHLVDEEKRLKEAVDFSTLFSSYTTADYMSAGLKGDDLNAFRKPGVDPERKWRIFAPYYKQIRNGSYARAARIAMGKFYGCEDLRSVEDAVAVTERIQAGNRPGLYTQVLTEACKIERVVNFGGPIVMDKRFFVPVISLTHLTEIADGRHLANAAHGYGSVPTSLAAYVELLAKILQDYRAQGMRAVKFGTAYSRDLRFGNVTTADAEKLFNRIHDEYFGFRQFALGYNETRPLQDYLTLRMIEIATELDLPIVFHTGIHGNRNQLGNGDPLPLWNLFNRYVGTKFVLLHGGLPYIEETGILAKYFDNVYVDMAWMHIISPELSIRALRTWVDMVPQNKIFGFGGDCSVVEKVYGHLQLAKANIARALAAKVEDGALTEEDAWEWIQALLYRNSRGVYKLDDGFAIS